MVAFNNVKMFRLDSDVKKESNGNGGGSGLSLPDSQVDLS